MHFGNDPRPGDKQPIMAEKDEYVVNRNAARKHKHLLDYLNFIDEPRFDNRDMAHSAIDEAMALNTLSQVGMQEGGNIPQELTYGQKFAKRFPSKHKDPERAAGQERGLASVIDFFIPQSPLDVLMSVAPVGAFGKVGKRAMKKILERAKKVPGKKSPFREGRADVDMQHYTDYTELMDNPRVREEMLEEVLPIKKRPLSTMYDEEGEILDLVDVLKSQGLQQGGLIEDKGERKGGYSLGVKDELAESVDYFQDLDKILSAVRHQDRYDFGKSERSTIDFLGESGIMDIEEALKHLDHIQKRYHEGTVGFHMPRYQSGGTITYGDQSSNMPTLEEIYSMAGVKPNAEQKSQFETNFTYDPTREGTTISSYMGSLAGNRQSGSAGLGTATTKAQELGGGFAGFGERKAMTQEARAGAENIYGAAVESSQRGMFEDIRGDREAYIQAALSELQRLEGIGGTNPYFENTSGMSEGEQQYHHQAEWYQLGFPDVDSYDAWIASGGDSSTMGSYGQDPSAALGNLGTTVGLSDRRLKKDVNYLFTMENNVPIYTFKYNWSDDIEIGTMAQDIEDIIPEAVSELNGYKLVDYKQIFK